LVGRAEKRTIWRAYTTTVVVKFLVTFTLEDASTLGQTPFFAFGANTDAVVI
jgi:hypothetical protein